jgi:hypothetical protein
MKFCRGSFAYRSAGTSPGIGTRTLATANLSMYRAMTAASPGSGPALTRPFASTAAYTLSFDWYVAR